MDKDELLKDLFEALDDEVLYGFRYYDNESEFSVRLLMKCENLNIGQSKALEEMAKPCQKGNN